MLTGTFHVGDPVSIKLTFDPSTPATGAIPTITAYDYITFDVTFGSYTASYVPDGAPLTTLVVVNNGNTGLGTADAFNASGFDQSAGAPVSGLLLQEAFFTLFDFTQTVFSDTSLPSSLNLGDFQTKVAGMQFCTNLACGVDANPNQVQATIRSLTVVGTAPEPTTWTLALLGLCAVAATRFKCPHQRHSLLGIGVAGLGFSRRRRAN
jgi:hypothetical protein